MVAISMLPHAEFECNDHREEAYHFTWLNFAFGCWWSQFQIFPNPTNGNFQIDLDQPINKATLTITDLSGKQVFSQNFSNLADQTIDHKLDSGTYIISISSNQTLLGKQKLVVQK